MSPAQPPAKALPAAVAQLCPACGLSDARLAQPVGCLSCGLPGAMREWVDARADDAGGAVAAGLLTTGVVGVAAVALAALEGSLSAALTAAVLASPLIGTGGWGAQELRSFRRRQRDQGREFRCATERLVNGGTWWVEARVHLDERGAITRGQGRAWRPVVEVPGPRSREQVPADEWAALWLLALFEAQSEVAIDSNQQWDWSCAPSADGPSERDAPYRGAPSECVVWQHRGGRPQASVSLQDRLEVLHGQLGFRVQADVRQLPLVLTRPVELGALVEQMLAAEGPLADQLARCRAFLDDEPASMQRRVGALATLAQR